MMGAKGRSPGPVSEICDAVWEEIDEPAQAKALVDRKSAGASPRPPASQPSLHRGLAIARKVIGNVLLGWLLLTFSIGGLQASCTSARRLSSIPVSQIDTSQCPGITGIALIDRGPRVLLPPEMQWGRHSR